MTLRTVTYDTATHNIVPLEPTEGMRKACSRDRYWDEIDKEWDAMIAAAPEYQEPDLVNFDFEQNWANVDGAIAWHLIDRHADGWAEVGRMMNDWLKANQEPTKDE